ncbi:MAG: serine/threonine-protein kinase, partial [Planctomycetota bacterium]
MQKKLGELAIQAEWLNKKELESLLILQEEKRKRGFSTEKTLFGKLCLENHYFSEEQLQDILVLQKAFLDPKEKGNSTLIEKNNLEKNLQKSAESEFLKEFDTFKKTDITQNQVKKIIFPETQELSGKESIQKNRGILSESFSPPPIVPKKIESRYTVLKTLGEGGMGVVQLVKDELLGREVALKRIRIHQQNRIRKDNHFLWRLQREAEIMAVLEHPNIVPLYEMQVKEEGELQFTMKKIEGKTLRELLHHSQETIDQQRYFLEILLKVCDGIRYAHSKNIIHRDLKPDNIMIGSYGEVYILDWGIAKKLEETTSKEDSLLLENNRTKGIHTIGGIGTPGYMPPEQQRSASSVDQRADIYMIGKILRECYLKMSPWEEIQQLVESQVNLKPTTLQQQEKQVPKEIKAIINKATEPEIDDRYENIQA